MNNKESYKEKFKKKGYYRNKLRQKHDWYYMATYGYDYSKGGCLDTSDVSIMKYIVDFPLEKIFTKNDICLGMEKSKTTIFDGLKALIKWNLVVCNKGAIKSGRGRPENIYKINPFKLAKIQNKRNFFKDNKIKYQILNI